MSNRLNDLLRSLPAVDRLLAHERTRAWLAGHPRTLVVSAVQSALDAARAALRAGESAAIGAEALLDRAEQILVSQATPSLRRVINATGVVLHTGLGRAPLAPAALAAVADCARGYCSLELDLATGQRGQRSAHVADLLCELTGAEAATVVNNNAAATLIILHTLARSREVIVSRGQLVEIGGSYRLPEMMAASGALLREIGTTNRTRLADYERAIGENSAALLRVHTSNYRVVGFTQEVSIAELVALGRRANLPVIDDLGSGALAELPAALADEPQVRASISAGADLVCFSGDKLLGGPQAGIILGRRDLIRRIEANPLMRTYRTDKLVLAALAATLNLHRDPAQAMREIPTLAMLTAPLAVLERLAQALADLLRHQLPAESFEVIADHSVAGGGALPARDLKTRCVAWRPASAGVDETLARLRAATPPVIARAQSGAILFDARTLTDAELPELASAVAAASQIR